MFTNPTVNVAEGLFPGQKKKIEFPYTDMHITQVISTCGCSEAQDHPDEQKVTVVYTAQDIPYQVLQLGKNFVNVKKELKVKYHISDPSIIQETTISFTAIVSKNI